MVKPGLKIAQWECRKGAIRSGSAREFSRRCACRRRDSEAEQGATAAVWKTAGKTVRRSARRVGASTELKRDANADDRRGGRPRSRGLLEQRALCERPIFIVSRHLVRFLDGRLAGRARRRRGRRAARQP